MSTLRVATWNLWWRFGPWERREPLIAAELERIGADVVGLQEVWADVGDRANPPAPEVVVDGEDAGGEAQPARLAASVGMPHYRYAWRHAHEGLAFGNAILSRHPIVGAWASALPAEGFEEHRTVLAVDVETPAGRLRVATTHLNFMWDQSHVRQAQTRHCSAFLAELDDRPALPTILTGDFNAEFWSDEMRLLTGRSAVPVPGLGFFDAWEIGGGQEPGETWTRENGHAAAISLEPDRRIDFVLAGYPGHDRRGRVARAERFGVAATDGLHPSDHFGVLADLAL